MLHRSELGEHASKFPADRKGHVPEHHDHWSKMDFDHGAEDPNEAGISAEERERRIRFLDEQWWPRVIAQVHEERAKLAKLPGGTPIRRWRESVMTDTPVQHGFEPGEL